MAKFDITIAVDGYYTTTVEASSETEAGEKALEELKAKNVTEMDDLSHCVESYDVEEDEEEEEEESELLEGTGEGEVISEAADLTDEA